MRKGRSVVNFIAGKAIVQKLGSCGISLIPRGRTHDHGDQLHSVSLGRCRNAEAGLGGGTGFQAVCSVVKADETVGVGQTEGTVAHGIHPYSSIIKDFFVLQKLFGHDCNISCRGQVGGCGIIQPVGIFKMTVAHAQFCGSAVHIRNKALQRSRNGLCQGRRRIVCRSDHHAFQQFVNGHLLSLLQIHLRTAHLGRLFADRDRILKVEFSLLNCLKNQKQSHDFGDGGRRQTLVRIQFIEHLAGGALHQNQTFGLGFNSVAPRHQGKSHKGQQGKQQGQFFSHFHHILSSFLKLPDFPFCPFISKKWPQKYTAKKADSQAVRVFARPSEPPTAGMLPTKQTPAKPQPTKA